MRTTTQVRVRFADTDAAGIVHYARYLGYLDSGRAAGIVHYARYLGYLDSGRAEALRATGLSSDMIATCGMHARLIQAVIRYRAPARFDDLLDVHAWVVDVSESQFRFAYEIQRPADQVLIATSETVHSWADAPQPGGVQLPGPLLAALNQLRN